MPRRPPVPSAVLLVLATALVTSAGAAPAPAFAPAGEPDGPGEIPPPRVWTDRSIPTDRDLHDAAFADDANGWVGADGGIVYRTVDGGETWDPVDTGLEDPVVALSRPTPDVGYAASGSQGLARTTDGGETWTVVQDGGMIGPLHDVAFADASHGYRTGMNGLYRGFLQVSDDGGATWTGTGLALPDQFPRYEALHVDPDGSHVWVLTRLSSAGWGVARTTDGGGNWSFHAVNEDGVVPDLRDVDMANETTGVVVGARGEIHRTTDGGATWERVPAPTTGTLHDAHLQPDGDGWAVGSRGTVVRTADGGASWTAEASGTAVSLQAASFAGDGRGWAVGDAGEVRHRPASPWSPLDGAPDDAPVAERPPIVIASDAGFEAPGSGVRGGSGTAEDPYVVGGWSIRPAGPGGIVLAGTDAHVVVRGNLLREGVGPAPAVRLVGADNVTVVDNRVEDVAAALEARGAQDLEVRGNVGEDLRQTGLRVEASPRAELTGNALARVDGPAIQVRGTAPLQVEGNAVSASGSGVVLEAAADLDDPAGVGDGASGGDVTVVGNTVDDTSIGIRVQGVAGAQVTGNRVEGAASQGIVLRGSAGVTLEGNVLAGAIARGIQVGPQAPGTTVVGNQAQADETVLALRESRDVTVSGNHLQGGTRDTVRLSTVDEATVRENVVVAPQQGFDLADGTSGTTLADNTVRSERWGIWLRGADVGGNRVVGNDVASTSPPGSAGIYVAANFGTVGSDLPGMGPDPDLVRGNTVEGMATGIAVAGGEVGTRVVGNTVEDAAHDGIGFGAYARDALVRDNTVRNVSWNGIELTRRADNVTVEGNLVEDVGGSALVAGSSSNGTLRGNLVRNASVGYESLHECPFGESYCDSEDNRLAGNTFRNLTGPALATRTEAWGRSVNLTVEDNAFETDGLVWRLREARRFSAHGNALEADAVGLNATGSGPVDVTGNWWGASDGPSGEGPGSGAAVLTDKATSADWTPWLEAPPAGAGT